ncbi:hypothetical protein SAMN05216282_11151 [Cryobacterium psychrotolerans]|uniref:Uncharacterized protein n=1 Tax=Cryobacterium psychrotolerans TaxID=386301 RepID=A0A1G9E6M4_9MICO|nr:hypothetical protein SAMN05216282_11151 [Cryobacterium psychrotolerans]
MDERARQIRDAQVWGVAVANVLIQAEDMDLWLEAHNLALRAVSAARIKGTSGPEPHEDGPGHTN